MNKIYIDPFKPYPPVDKGTTIYFIHQKVMELCDEHNIRLTPTEMKELAIRYQEKYIKNIDIESLINISNDIINSKR